MANIKDIKLKRFKIVEVKDFFEMDISYIFLVLEHIQYGYKFVIDFSASNYQNLHIVNSKALLERKKKENLNEEIFNMMIVELKMDYETIKQIVYES